MSASEQLVTSRIIEPMKALYRQPYGMDDGAPALAQYTRSLRHFSADELDAGWDKLITTYKGKSWPSLGEIIAAIDKAKPPKTARTEEPDHVRRYRFADQAMRTDLGRQACEEGWNLGFYWFAFNQERFPEKGEIIQMRRDREGFDGDMQRLALEDRPDQQRWFRVGLGMMKRRDQMAEQYWPQLRQSA